MSLAAELIAELQGHLSAIRAKRSRLIAMKRLADNDTGAAIDVYLATINTRERITEEAISVLESLEKDRYPEIQDLILEIGPDVIVRSIGDKVPVGLGLARFGRA